MKKNYLYIFLSIFFIAGWASCDDEDPIPSVVEDIKAYPGRNSAKIEFAVPSGVSGGKVFYGGGDFQEYVVTESGTQSVIVKELSEGEQTIRVVTIDSDGRTSNPRGIVVYVYGDSYENGLKTREFYYDKSIIEETSATLAFGAANEGEIGTWIVYHSTSGAIDSLMMSSTETTISIDKIDTSQPYSHYSVYKPVSESIDEFYSARVQTSESAMYKLEKDKWTVEACDQTDEVAANIVDNDITTQWHSHPWIDNPQMPHWVIVDMQAERRFDGFFIVQSQTESVTGLAKGFRFEISQDGSEWENVFEGELTTSRTRQEFALPRQAFARYFKITILSGQDPSVFWTQLAEVDLYNEMEVSGLNGAIDYVNIDLVNAQPPFDYDPVKNHLGKLTGWSTSSNVEANYISEDWGLRPVLVGGPLQGLADVVNGKVYQTVTLDPGDYIFEVDCAHMDGYNNPGDPISVDAYGVVNQGTSLPDISNVSASLSHVLLTPSSYNGHNVMNIPFTVSSKDKYTVGWVYTTGDNGNGYAAFTLNGVRLLKVIELSN